MLACDATAKQALLRALTSLPPGGDGRETGAGDSGGLEIGTVQLARVATLEETYMKHAGSI